MRNRVLLACGVAFAATLATSNIAAADGFSASPLAPGQSATFVMTPVSITQSSSLTIVALNSVSCNDGVGHTDNSYMRRFDLDGMYGFAGPFSVSSVDIGLEAVISGTGGPQPISVRLYTIPNAASLLFANLTLIGIANLNIPPQSLTLLHVPVVGVVPNSATHDLVVEVFTPDGQAVGNLIWVGSNSLPETAPTYIAAAGCEITEPTPLGAIGFPGMHMVMVVNGDQQPTSVASTTFGKLKAMYR
jgi:hypothetical protein